MPDDLVNECLFCRIVSGQLPANRLYEDEVVLAFPDIDPQAPVHALVIPKEHLSSTTHALEEHAPMLGRLTLAAAKLAEQLGLNHGYRLVVNTGPHGGQTVQHLHMHLLGGRPMTWPPG